MLSNPPGNLPVASHVASQEDEQKYAADQRESPAGQAHQVHHHGAVLTGSRVIVVTEQQNLIHRAADLVLGGFHQTEADIGGRILHSVEVAGQAAFGSQHHDAAGVRELIGRGIVPVVIADGVHESRDVGLVAGQQVPAVSRARTAVAAQVHLLLGGGGLFEQIAHRAGVGRLFDIRIIIVRRKYEHFGGGGGGFENLASGL